MPYTDELKDIKSINDAIDRMTSQASILVTPPFKLFELYKKSFVENVILMITFQVFFDRVVGRFLYIFNCPSLSMCGKILNIFCVLLQYKMHFTVIGSNCFKYL